ncbi:glycosyltransferase [Acinetobacter schindleri]|uniref:glycosyltransferase n=1 Tax=Acinetobacter schindleri TaxID=108981 RepID=UPI0022F39729|nr:glycosyltransferase [Acinetobacter schindleri]WBX38187.1 glycosyltransferase [Acinetobacter schindleri]
MNNSSPLNNERPLVTFALFAYNQEQYIREAIEGAFSQTYEPLEIILSDDCSSDLTFEIMQEMAAAYQGPHQVIVRQSDVNRGTFNHILDVAQQSHGEYIVVAAGDDISLPERTSTVIPYFKDKNVLALSSDEIIINECGDIQNCDESRFAQRDNWYKNNNTWLHGGMAVYRTEFLKKLPYSVNKIYFEDAVFPILIGALGGRTVRLQLPLIKYRYHSANVSIGKLKTNNYEFNEIRFIDHCKSFLKAYSYCKEVIDNNSNIFFNGDQFFSKKSINIKYLKLISEWPNLNLYSKISLTIIAIRLGEVRTTLPRLFGKKIFFLLKKIQKG